tara:strand:+ start:3872 stop:5533 length:1662 start_codon:yes stop_codon:yes gene_type:complete
MCGIFALINSNKDFDLIKKEFQKGKIRGPENTELLKINNTYIGFHRLAINGLNDKSNQPFHINNIYCICNGEIYNYKSLAHDYNIILTTDSDCEIIIQLYIKFGIEKTIKLLDGVFSFFIYDTNINKFFIGRDPHGVRPLYYFNENNTFGFASDLKVLYNLCDDKSNIHNFTPSHYFYISQDNNTIYFDKLNYYRLPDYNLTINNNNNDFNDLNIIYNNIVDILKKSVHKRVIDTCERPIACLLSGGLDSSLIAALVNDYLKNKNKKLATFSIGLKDSEDLKYAKIVAQHINSEHTEIILTEDEFFDSIPHVIYDIESYDTTTIRASVGNYLIGKYIKNNTDYKVIFNGDGADELMGGYLYFRKCPNFSEFNIECKRLLENINRFDVLRSDKSISSHGLEPRTPFLDKNFVDYYICINNQLKQDTTFKLCEKYLIRKAFEINMPGLLPKNILWRKKEAFSDGVSSLKKSWYTIINEKIKTLYQSNHLLFVSLTLLLDDKNTINPPRTYEQAYYKYLYNLNYKGTDSLIPYFWMPKFVIANDASARSLDIYNQS